MTSILTWITTAISVISKIGPLWSWILKMFPQMGFAQKLVDLLNKINANPNYPISNLLQDIVDLFANAVTPVPTPPGMAGTEAPDYHEVFSSADCATAYAMLPDDIKQYTIDQCHKITGDPQAIGLIPWPVIATFFQAFGPFAKKMIDMFISTWASKRKVAIQQIKNHIAAIKA